MSLETVPAELPVLALFNHVVFPASQVTISVPKAFAPQLSRIVKNEDGHPPLIAAVPVLNPESGPLLKDAKLSEWGCAARVLRYIRPTPLSPNSCILTLAGVARVRLETPLPVLSETNRLPHHPVQYSVVDSKKGITEPAAEAFRGAAIRLVERLDAETKSQERKGKTSGVEWKKLRTIIEDAEMEKTPFVADILMAVVSTIPWSDRLQMLSTSSPAARLQLATSIFSKQASIAEVSHKINTAVDESLTKQQKEYYLRQQLQAIQRELANLNRPSQSGAKSSGDSSSKGEGSNEFDEEGDDAEYFTEMRKKIESMMPDSEERKMGVKEYRRLKRIPGGSVEHGVIRTYLDWLTALPWPSSNIDPPDSLEILRDPSFLMKAREQLDSDHFGLDQIKRRLIEHLAVIRLKALAQSSETQDSSTSAIISPVPDVQLGDPVSSPPGVVPLSKSFPNRKLPTKTKGPILLFVGPPGCGKTSIASSLAKALGRPFHRISLGGVRDEAEIRGHRRTYVASGPGAIVTAMAKVKRPDPVILLDEIDKVGHASYQGDPAAALLEVLDPEQNVSFKDHYLNVPLDLSQVTFIATANTLDTISEPLLDRCEVIRLSGYTYPEKIHIAQKFLLPKQLDANGLPKERVTITDDAYLHIASYYTREAGVRNLERALGGICRWKAVEWTNINADHTNTPSSNQSAPSIELKEGYNSIIDVDDLEKILGVPRWDPQEREREERKGVVYGLVVSGYGEGGVLPVESVMTSGSGKLKLTGSLGEVIRESGEIALSWVRSHAYVLGLTPDPSSDPLQHPNPIDIHLHLPAGAVKKDGPSAGVAYVCAFVSLLSGLLCSRFIAMTGEVSLRGRVLAVGGIKEKVLGAHREGITKIILPRSNRKDVEHDVPQEILEKMEFVYVSRLEEVLEAAFGPGVFTTHRGTIIMESRL